MVLTAVAYVAKSFLSWPIGESVAKVKEGGIIDVQFN